jgi:hypothetical protein
MMNDFGLYIKYIIRLMDHYYIYLVYLTLILAIGAYEDLSQVPLKTHDLLDYSINPNYHDAKSFDLFTTNLNEFDEDQSLFINRPDQQIDLSFMADMTHLFMPNDLFISDDLASSNSDYSMNELSDFDIHDAMSTSLDYVTALPSLDHFSEPNCPMINLLLNMNVLLFSMQYDGAYFGQTLYLILLQRHHVIMSGYKEMT